MQVRALRARSRRTAGLALTRARWGHGPCLASTTGSGSGSPAGMEVNAAKVLLARKQEEGGHGGGGGVRTADDAGPAKSPLSKEVSAGESDDEEEGDEHPHEELPPDLAAEAILKQGYLMKRGKTKRVRPCRSGRLEGRVGGGPTRAQCGPGVVGGGRAGVRTGNAAGSSSVGPK